MDGPTRVSTEDPRHPGSDLGGPQSTCHRSGTLEEHWPGSPRTVLRRDEIKIFTVGRRAAERGPLGRLVGPAHAARAVSPQPPLLA